MRIWHEQLIPCLCQKHLCAMWREGLGAYKIITEDKKGYRNHPAVKEFKNYPARLHERLCLVREEMLKRGYHPKQLPEIDTVGFEVRYVAIETPWQTLEEQIEVLSNKNCKCNINKLKGFKTDLPSAD